MLDEELLKVPPQIPGTICFSAVMCVNTIGFFSHYLTARQSIIWLWFPLNLFLSK